jgi:SAM-dependent methyltransferase
LRPIGKSFGRARGTPIDRYYIERFLARHAGSPGYILGEIRGCVLEIGEDKYTRRFGAVHEGRPEDAPSWSVSSVDIFHGDASNGRATIVGDLATGDGVPSDAFDCIIVTQTLQVIYDLHGAIGTLHRALKPGGILLATVPGICQVCRPDVDLWGEYWRFTSVGVRRLFEEWFPAENLTVEASGNVLTAISFLHGIAVEDLRSDELDLHDPDYEVNIAVRAVKG